MRVVLDTNVLVAGLLSPHGPPGRLLDLLLQGLFQIVTEDRVLAEYDDVLRRPRFGFQPRDVEILLSFLRSEANHVTAPHLPVELPHEDDRPFLEAAAAAQALLITGNPQHFPRKARRGVKMLDPAAALSKLLEP